MNLILSQALFVLLVLAFPMMSTVLAFFLTVGFFFIREAIGIYNKHREIKPKRLLAILAGPIVVIISHYILGGRGLY